LNDEDAAVRAILETLDPRARDTLRRVLIRDRDARDAISSRLMRYCTTRRRASGYIVR
jgi:predicted thioredoxin/glutaredoxin